MHWKENRLRINEYDVVMRYCRNCGTKLSAGTKYCPECGEAVSDVSGERLSDAVRKGTTNADFNKQMSDLFVGEVVILSIAIGMFMQSWWWGGGVFLGLFILTEIPAVNKLICVIFGLAWGVVGYWLGSVVIGDSSAGWVMGVIAALAGIGANMAGSQYLNDLGD